MCFVFVRQVVCLYMKSWFPNIYIAREQEQNPNRSPNHSYNHKVVKVKLSTVLYLGRQVSPLELQSLD